VPGSFIERSALPLTPGANRPAPISQSACSAVWSSAFCLVSEPNACDVVQCSRLALVFESGLELGDAVRQLAPDHVEAAREAPEDHSVAVAEHHLPAVPERVVEELAVMNRGVEPHALVVDRAAAEAIQKRSYVAPSPSYASFTATSCSADRLRRGSAARQARARRASKMARRRVPVGVVARGAMCPIA
jgi:hypothetical protein